MAEFTIPGSESHAAALCEFYALMLERAGDAKAAAAQRELAAELAEDAKRAGVPVLSLDAITKFAALLLQEQAAEREAAYNADKKPWNAPFEEGEIVCAGPVGRPAKLVRIFSPDADERVRGKGLIQLPRATATIDVPIDSLRRASPDEIKAYQEAGGT